MRKIQLLIVICCLFAHTGTSFAQSKLRNLFFNSTVDVVRLDFSTNPPTPYNTGIAGSYEGIAHFEDEFGNLMFWYTSNGVNDKNGDIMPGSIGIFANSSSTEINLCPVVGNPNQFYIFYNAEVCTKLYYSIIDMTLNGGLGDVIKKNTLIDGGNFAEGLEVISIPQKNEYWLLTYECNKGYKKFLIDAAGINPGQSIYPFAQPGGFDGRGEFDYHKGRIGHCFAFANTVFLADFDPETGDICNPVVLEDPLKFNSAPFGVEFSPDGSKMYFSLWYTLGIPNVFQYDFSLGTYKAFLPSLGGVVSAGLGQIELGADGKLYIVEDGGTNILVIDNPNDKDPVFSTIPIKSTTGLGISDHIQSFVYIEQIGDTICAEVGKQIILKTKDPNLDWQWFELSDPGTILSTTTELQVVGLNTPQTFKASGIKAGECLKKEEIYTLYPIPDISVDPLSATIEKGQSVQLTATTTVPDVEILWYPADGLDDPFSFTPIASPTQTTTYFASVGNKFCQNIAEITITIVEKNVQYDTLCVAPGAVATLSIADSLVNVKWSVLGNSTVIATGTTYNATMGTSQITYRVEANNPNIAGGIIKEITLLPTPQLSAGSDVQILPGASATLNATGGGPDGYTWSPSSYLSDPTIPNPVASPPKTQQYVVSSSIFGYCLVTDTVVVTVGTISGDAVALCINPEENVQLTAPDTILNVQWTVNQTNIGTGPTLNLTPPINISQTYTATGETPQGNIFNLNYKLNPNPTLTATNANVLLGQSTTLNVSGATSYQWSPDTYLSCTDCPNPTCTPTQEITYTITGTDNNGCQNTTTLKVSLVYDGFLIAPSAFTPNNDGINDMFILQGKNIESLTNFVVYNRWGKLVYTGTDLNTGWDGTTNGNPNEVGVYVYYAQGKVAASDNLVTVKGNISLLR